MFRRRTRPGSLALALLLAASALGVGGPTVVEASEEEVDPAAEDAFFTGIALLEAGDARGAIQKFDLALRVQSSLRRVHFYRARAWVRVGDVAKAAADADAYGRFSLEAAEREQLDGLRKEIEQRRQTLAAPEPTPGPTVPPPVTAPSGLTLLADAETALSRGDCKAAADMAASALVVDPTLARAFLVKGLALECQGELSRARDLLGTYRELRAGMPEDPVAAAAITRLDAALRPGAATPAKGPAPPTLTPAPRRAPGRDPRITGVLREPFGASVGEVVSAKSPRKEDVPGVGPATVGIGRTRLAGATVRVERAWVLGDQGLSWTRMRVRARAGWPSTDWLRQVWLELYDGVVRDSGAPDVAEGWSGDPKAIRSWGAALAGRVDLSAMWRDRDGDRIELRAGRCTEAGDESTYHPDTSSCVEIVGHAGTWSVEPGDRKAAAAAARMEAVGPRRLDLAVGLGAGFSGTIWNFDDTTEPAPGGAVDADLLIRFAIQNFAFGVAGNLGVAGHSLLPLGSDPLVDGRFLLQAGVRIAPLQRTHADIVLGAGLDPDTQPPFAASLRITVWTRTAEWGRFQVSFEPGVVRGQDSMTVTPFRFSIGGAIGPPSQVRKGS